MLRIYEPSLSLVGELMPVVRAVASRNAKLGDQLADFGRRDHAFRRDVIIGTVRRDRSEAT